MFTRKLKKIVASTLIIGILGCNSYNVGAYSGANAATYAKKYATSYNSAYHAFDNDCTNFASQCVFAGGKSISGYKAPVFGGTTEATSSKWYYVSLNSSPYYYACSTPWIRCGGSNAFYHYWNSSIIGTYSSLSNVVKNARVGDVIQICHSDGYIQHSIICTSKTSSEIYCASHTSDYANDSLTEINRRAKNAWGSGLMYCIYRFS